MYRESMIPSMVLILCCSSCDCECDAIEGQLEQPSETPPTTTELPANASEKKPQFQLYTPPPAQEKPKPKPVVEEKRYPQDFGTTFQDKQLNKQIRKAMSQGWHSDDYDRLSIQTNNGAVVISGTVANEEDIQKLKEELKNLKGVGSLSFQINVQP